jgi:hypothetical protein
VELVTSLGGDPLAFATILDRIASSKDPGLTILLDHPQTKDRVATVKTMAQAHPPQLKPLLTPAEWSALKRICG